MSEDESSCFQTNNKNTQMVKGTYFSM